VRAHVEQRPHLVGAGGVGPGLLQLHAQVDVLTGQPRVLLADAAERGVPFQTAWMAPATSQLASWTSVTTATTVVRSNDGLRRRDLRRDEEHVASTTATSRERHVCRRPREPCVSRSRSCAAG